jgi:DNA phosphorothioation-associated putative methyltransferase
LKKNYIYTTRKLNDYFDEIKDIPFGKRLPNAIYMYRFSGARLSSQLRGLIQGQSWGYHCGRRFNVLKFNTLEPIMSFLSYPDFLVKAHPELKFAVHVKVLEGSTYEVDYSKRDNPPILHRKELMLPEGFPGREEMLNMTQEEEALGLYDEPSTIGNRKQWEDLCKSKGIKYKGHQLIK